MRLEGSDLTCVRGGREVFAGISFARPGRGPAGHRSQRRRQVVAAAADRRLLRPEAGTISFDGGDPELTVGEQAHYVGHLTRSSRP